MTPRERIWAAHGEFRQWRADSALEQWQRDLAESDRRGTALARLVGTLMSLASREEPLLSPEDLVEAVEVSLRIADTDLIFGRTSEPKPLSDPDFAGLRKPIGAAS